MLCAQRCGQLSGRVPDYACRDSFFWICGSSPNRPQITQICADESKTEQATTRISRKFVGHVRCPTKVGHQNGCPTMNNTPRSRASHVGARPGVDLDRFAFLDEKRHVDGLAGFELCRLGDVAGGISAQTFS